MAARKNTTCSEATRKKMSESHMGHKHSEEAIANMKTACNTPESKERRRLSHLEKPLSEEHKAAIKSGLNKPETRALRSEIASNRTHTEATKLLLSEIMNSEEVNAKISESVKRKFEDPEFKERHRQASIATNTTDAYRANMSEVIRQVQATDGWKQNHSAAMQRDEVRETISSKATKRWEDMTDGQRAAHIERLKINGPTSIELIVKACLDDAKIEYLEQHKIGWYRVDFYIPLTNTVLEVNGCYWHSCSQCGFEYLPKRASDARRLAYLERKGYTVITFWEHDINKWEEGHIIF